LIAFTQWCAVSNVRQLRREKPMTYSLTVANLAITDELPAPTPVSVVASSATVLPRPVSAGPSVADTGRIRFGAGFRLASK
jgi:hypothetical protein